MKPRFNPEYEAMLTAARKRRQTALKMREQSPPKTLQEIGDALGVSRERAHQMIKRAIEEREGAPT
jgi:DNA-directed RNA polymerase sigma subunit (sigma70/sigma32)